MTAIVNDDRSTGTELLEHRGYQIRLTHAGLEWIAAVALPEQRPTLIMASDREAAIAKAYEWIELQQKEHHAGSN
ncbi:hypothetical protein ILT44_23920 [Microvirga sp. BT689]|uniref:hypothetical protein n=1 Tax=Microvirga arvi TaxID=2778731 RepID=UPI00194DFCCA|nr:hypothetical protein [Microvirga arvi]MBM6583254.1 hypothetical protein [Microvirga arvi]